MEGNSEESKMEVFAKTVNGFSFLTILQKAQSQMFGKILSSALKPVTTCEESSISDVLIIFAKLLPICLLFTKFY